MIKMGLVGCGGMGTHHARTYANMPDVQMVAVADLVEEKAQKLAGEIGARPLTDFREMLDEVDAVLVCTEAYRHTDVVCECAEAGKKIFAEKPLATNLEDADRTIETIERTGVLFMTGYVLRYTHPYKLLCETFTSGELGQLVNCWTRRYMPCSMVGIWYGEQDKSGGVVLDFGSHDIDLMCWCGGPVKSVFASAARVRQGIRSDEHTHALFQFADRGAAAIDVSWSSYLSETSLGVVGTEGSIIVGHSGEVRKRIGDGEEQIISTQGNMDINMSGQLGKKDAEGNIKSVASPDETIQQHFLRCIREGIEPRTNARDARLALSVALAATESARTGKCVDL